MQKNISANIIKRMISLGLVCALALGTFSACSSGKKSTPEEQTAAEEAAEATVNKPSSQTKKDEYPTVTIIPREENPDDNDSRVEPEEEPELPPDAETVTVSFFSEAPGTEGSRYVYSVERQALKGQDYELPQKIKGFMMAGYILSGWQQVESGGKTGKTYQIGQTVKSVKKDIAFIPVWIPDCTVTFTSGLLATTTEKYTQTFGAGDMNATLGEPEISEELLGELEEGEGFAFAGWAESVNGSTKYSAGTTFGELLRQGFFTKSSEQFLYARWYKLEQQQVYVPVNEVADGETCLIGVIDGKIVTLLGYSGSTVTANSATNNTSAYDYKLQTNGAYFGDRFGHEKLKAGGTLAASLPDESMLWKAKVSDGIRFLRESGSSSDCLALNHTPSRDVAQIGDFKTELQYENDILFCTEPEELALCYSGNFFAGSLSRAANITLFTLRDAYVSSGRDMYSLE